MDEERDIDRSWESVLRTPEQLTLDYDLVTPEIIYDAIAAGELAAFSVGDQTYVSLAGFFVWVAIRSDSGRCFEVVNLEGQRVLMSDPRGIPGCPLTGHLKEHWQKRLRGSS